MGGFQSSACHRLEIGFALMKMSFSQNYHANAKPTNIDVPRTLACEVAPYPPPPSEIVGLLGPKILRGTKSFLVKL